MASVWDNIGIKKGPGGAGNVTTEQKNSTISDAVHLWTLMGLTQEQIAYAIAAMGVESGFNPDAKSSTGPSGLGQFSKKTWEEAAKYYNEKYGGNIDPYQRSNDPIIQMAVMGAWSKKIWEKAQEYAKDPMLKKYSVEEIAYALHHESYYSEKEKVKRYLESDGYKKTAKDYLKDTNKKANEDLKTIAEGSGTGGSGTGGSGGSGGSDSGGSGTGGSGSGGSGSGTGGPDSDSSPTDDAQEDKEEAEGAAPEPPRRDPLILDLNGNGIKTKGVKDGAYFDNDINGFAEQTGWAGSNDGLLTLDRNNDGIINDGRELFGDQTILNNGSRASNGFQALAELDDNNDGKIDVNDTVYSQLKVWQDLDGDGYSSPDELLSLSEAGVSSINLTSTPTNVTDPQGNTETRAGSFTKTDGSDGLIAEYRLQRDTTYTIATEWLEVPEDIALLPDLEGYGNVYDLQQAMAREALSGQQSAISLKSLVEQFTTTTDIAERNSLMEQILFKWTGVEGIDPASRGGSMDARKLAVVEKLLGDPFVGTNGPNPTALAAVHLNEAYRKLSEMYYAELMGQTHLKDLYGMITYSWDEAAQNIKSNLSGVITEIQNQLTNNPEQGKQTLGEFSRSIRGLGIRGTFNYLSFRESFVNMNPDLGWTIDSGGLPVYDSLQNITKKIPTGLIKRDMMCH